MRVARGRLLLVALLVTLAMTATVVALGRSLLRGDDRVDACDVVVVLNGSHPVRAVEAVRLHLSGVGRDVWLTSDPRSAGPDGRDAGTVSNLTLLVAAGVPKERIVLLAAHAAGTRAELEVVAGELRRRGLGCAVLVTSAIHGPRVRLTWAWTIGPIPRTIVRTVDDWNAYSTTRKLQEGWLTLRAVFGFAR